MNIELKNHVLVSRHLKKEIIYSSLCTSDLENGDSYLLLVNDGDDYLKLGGIMEHFQHLILENGLQAGKLLFVLLPAGNSEQRWDYFHYNGNDRVKYEKFIYDELLPDLDKFFITKKLKVRKSGFLGDSLAAAAALRIALVHPEKWDYLILQSGAFHGNDLKRIEETAALLPWKVYQSVGLQEDSFFSPITNDQLFIYSKNLAAQKLLSEKVRRLKFVVKDERHLWVSWHRDLPDALTEFIKN